MNAAIAASVALPPRRRTSVPAAAASGLDAAIAPCRPLVPGLVRYVCAASGEASKGAAGAAARSCAVFFKNERRELLGGMLTFLLKSRCKTVAPQCERHGRDEVRT